MMARQTTFGDLELAGQRRTTRRGEFLEKMDAIVPFAAWCRLIRPFYYAGKGPGRPPRELETMLRMYLLQHWFGLSDEGCEDAVLDSRGCRGS
jgi:IS5 family transposase